MKLKDILLKGHYIGIGHERAYGFERVIAKIQSPKFSFSWRLENLIDNFGIPYWRVTKLLCEDPKSWLYKEGKTYSYWKKVLRTPWSIRRLARKLLYNKTAYELHCPKCGRNHIERVNWFMAKEYDDELLDKCQRGHEFLEEDTIVVPVAWKGL